MNVQDSNHSFSRLSNPLKIQPIMDAKGVVAELALVGEWMQNIGDLAREASAEALREAGGMFRANGCLTPLTMDHQLNVCADVGLADQLCRDLRIAGVGAELLSPTGEGRECALPIYPSAKVIYNVPLSERLLVGADVFRQYTQFKAALRIRLLPREQDGAPAPVGTIQASGLRVDVPEDIHKRSHLQEIFFSLLGQASRKGLKLLVRDIRSIEDFNWLRMQPDVLFQGDVLSVGLSFGFVKRWLTTAGGGWQTFQLGTKMPIWGAASDSLSQAPERSDQNGTPTPLGNHRLGQALDWRLK